MDARPIFLSISDPSDFLREIRILFFFFFFLFEKRATYHRKRSLLNYSPERGADVSRWLKDGGLKLTRGIIIRKLLPLSLSLSLSGEFFRGRWCIRRFAFVAEVLWCPPSYSFLDRVARVYCGSFIAGPGNCTTSLLPLSPPSSPPLPLLPLLLRSVAWG